MDKTEMKKQILKTAALLSFLIMGYTQAAVLTDVRGVDLRMDRPPQRIISLAPHLTELLFSLGAGRRVVGTIEHSDFPEAAKSIPRVGDASRIDIERILSLRADLVVAWQSGNSDADIRKLERLGMPVYVTEPRTLSDVAALLRGLGRLTGRQVKARELASEYLERLRAMEQKYQNARPVTVFYQIWQQPLMTISGRHIISDAIRVCGGRNVFADLEAIAPAVDLEAVVAARPEVIIANSASDGGAKALQAFWAEWPSLTAVARGQIHAMPSSTMARPSLRIMEGVETLCRILEGARGTGGAASPN